MLSYNKEKLGVPRNSLGFFVCPTHQSRGKTTRFASTHAKCFFDDYRINPEKYQVFPKADNRTFRNNVNEGVADISLLKNFPARNAELSFPRVMR